MNEEEKHYSIADIREALGCSLQTASNMVNGKPCITRKNPKNYKMERAWPQSIVLPLCLKYKRDNTPPKGYITPAEAAALINGSQSNIYALMRRGKVKYALMPNGCKAVCEKSLTEYANRREASKMARAGNTIGMIRWHLNYLRSALYADANNPTQIASDSKALLHCRINSITTKLNELRKIIA